MPSKRRHVGSGNVGGNKKNRDMKIIFVNILIIIKWIWDFFCDKVKQDFWGFINILILFISIILIYEQLHIQSQSNVVQTLNSISEKWDSEQMMQARSNTCTNWIRIYSDSSKNVNKDSLFDFFADRNTQMVALYMEHIGLFYKIGAVTREDIWEIKSWEVENYYNIFKIFIEEERAKYNDKNFYRNFEHLYKAMQVENKRQGSPFDPPTIKELKEFCAGEIDLKNSK